ncbi:4Fe-4S binding protein [bacterium]|nr:4Fe-4S binding protein [bacterium]
MRTARRITQIAGIVLFFCFFLFASYPLKSWMPVDLFLRMDALAVLAASMAGRFVWLRFIPALAVLAVTLFLGRMFCGWICPLGSTLDAFDASANRRAGNKKTGDHPFRWIKYFLLVLLLTAALFSVNLAGWLSPVSLYTRTVTALIHPLFVYFMFGLLRLISAIPFLEDFSYLVQDALTGYLLPVTLPAFRGLFVIGLMFFIILFLSFAAKRFWCRNLCPLGALLGLFSIFRGYRRIVTDACTQCGKCQSDCRMGAIHPDPLITDHTECINCMDCQAICPTGAVRFGWKGRPSPQPVDLSRRRLLGAGLSGLVTLGLVNTAFISSVKKSKVVRPPGSLNEDAFLDRCIRCGECIRVCSTAGKGLHFTGFESGPGGLATPRLLTPSGYCEYNCNMCGQVCPTGAISKLTLEQKHRTKMGTAQFDKTRCIPWYYGETCLVCEEHCPVETKAIRFRETTVIAIDGRENTVLLPYVDESLCVGCGICTVVCPVSGEKGIFVTSAGEQRIYV